jgi:hypothetical protein
MKRLLIIAITFIFIGSLIYLDFSREPQGEFTTIEGLCEIERKTGSWRIIDGVVLKDLTKEQEAQCVNKTVKVSGYMTPPECNPSSPQCYSGNLLKVESIDFIN